MSDLSIIDKVQESEWFVRETVEKSLPYSDGQVHHYVEDRLGNFAAGRTMLQVLMKLAAFNAAFSYMIMNESLEISGVKGVSVQHIHPSTVKSLMRSDGLLIPKGADKKKLTLDFVVAKESKFPIVYNRNGKPQPWCYDEADSYIIAKAGMKKFPRSNAT